MSDNKLKVITIEKGQRSMKVARFDCSATKNHWTPDVIRELLLCPFFGTPDLTDFYLVTNRPVKIKITQDGFSGIIPVVINDFGLKTVDKQALNELFTSMNAMVEDITSMKKRLSKRAVLSVPKSLEVSTFRVEALNFTDNSSQLGYSVCLRPLKNARSPESLNLHPLVIEYYKSVTKGLHLKLGKTGSGKSTTLSSILAFIVEFYPILLVTLENPIEYNIDYNPVKCGTVLQYDTEENFNSTEGDPFKEGATSFLRYNPDLVLFGELRELDEIMSALETSTTGKGVFATAHTDRVWNVYSRLSKRIPAAVKDSSLLELASQIFSISAQMLIDSSDGGKIIINEFIAFDETERSDLSNEMANCINNQLGMSVFTNHFKSILKRKELEGTAISFEKHLKMRLDAGEVTQAIYNKTQATLQLDNV